MISTFRQMSILDWPLAEYLCWDAKVKKTIFQITGIIPIKLNTVNKGNKV